MTQITQRELDEKAKELIETDIHWNQTMLVDSILKLEYTVQNASEELPFTSEDIENLRVDPSELNTWECVEWLRDKGYDIVEDILKRYSEDEDFMEAYRDEQGEYKDVSNDSLEVMLQNCPDPDDESLLDELREAVEDNNEDAEVYEWWLVSPYLARKLQSEGEVILDAGYTGTWWGRQGTGQAIYIDGIIQKILISTYQYEVVEAVKEAA